jgi:hypothetical protein
VIVGAARLQKLGIAAVAAGMVSLTAFALPAQGSPMTINLVALNLSSDEFPSHSRYLDRLYTADGLLAGSAVWACVRKARHRFRCTDTYTLSSGKITALSTTASTAHPYPRASRKVTGGTGAYSHAAGSVAIKLIRGDGIAGSRYSVTIALR